MSLQGSLDSVHALLRASRFGEAERMLSALIAASPHAPELHHTHAALLQATGRHAEAIEAMCRAVRAAPHLAALRVALGQIYGAAGHADEAIDAFREATRLQPDGVEAWFLLGTTLYAAQRDAEALPVLRRAYALAPVHPQILRALAETEYALEHHAEALALYERIAAANATNPTQTANDPGLPLRLSQCERRTGAPVRALRQAQAGLARFPDEASLWMELGWVQEDLGDAAQAQAAYARAHALRPEWADPLGAAIALARDAAPDALVRDAEASLAAGRMPEMQQAFLHHTLGKRADSAGDYVAAATHWRAANRLRRAHDGGFERDLYASQIDAAIAAFTPDTLASLRGAALHDERPLFVVGMPRSGTTLAEQMLAAHPQAHGCGELTGIVSIAQDIADETGLEWPRQAANVPAAWLRERAQRYLALASRGAPGDARRLIDKMPYNFLHVGLLAMLFADARIVWCRRDPRDIALSIYSESFAPSATYATDLDDIAFVIAQQERLMRHWQAIAALPLLELQYETVVADTEAQIRRLVDFAGLPWDARCLDFHASARSVQTLSRWQVRQPVHPRSVGRWRRYPQWFGEDTSASN
ncbi:MAG: sulfotransferase [Xanthomonadaceae bacterium]|nr:sulfotransferase [Xanthomonadaceae bacterium]